ncbi:tRNA pseudouridine synthase D [Litchfieldella qijiaojingensis]|uniref:tRNA pseudouridine synthase D n=1 Tax=Litchfieldella qijiaojingensis TaxID=980347 RepID=A0ABQ2YKS0_9GAMM|nr:tRNA pseudouridine(13) synthase TruD [Halomonas qijiaojingensis]GGX86967.1 tRNA pseudouridine synthase D [Halomonas qijiaojingensis]
MTESVTAMPLTWPPAWPRALDEVMGQPPPRGDYRASPEDFKVEECLGFAPEGEGEHLWLWVEKRDLTTLELARRLARACEVGVRDIGYSGIKDRVAVTRQWFSVHLPGRATPSDLSMRLADTPVRVLEQVRHPRKLKRGVHRANRFELRLTGEVVRDPGVERRWQWLCEHGVPNYFGPQRFGPGGRNLINARAVLARGWRKRDDREGMLLSTARSYLFNTLLARRLTAGHWASALPGDVLILDGTASQFRADIIDAELRERLRQLDLHPSGVLWGTGRLASQADAAAYEQALAIAEPELCEGLQRAGVRMSRRALRVRLGAPALMRDDATLTLSFELPRGAFATAVVRELMAHPDL